MPLPAGQLANPLNAPSPTVNPGGELGMGGGAPSSKSQPTPFDTFTPTVVGPAQLTQGEIEALRNKISDSTGTNETQTSPFDPFFGGP